MFMYIIKYRVISVLFWNSVGLTSLTVPNCFEGCKWTSNWLMALHCMGLI